MGARLGVVDETENEMNKSVIRTSSGSYPYPRSHTTVMVLPSQRPIAKEDKETTLKPLRRPPLNRACPTIPESKSNESIMTQMSEKIEETRSTVEDDKCVIIENKMAETITKIVPPKTGIPRPSTSRLPPQPIRIRESKEKKEESEKEKKEDSKKNREMNKKRPQQERVTPRQEPPRSPLMTVAHSVRNRLSRLGRLGRSHDGSTIKGSTSEYSMRPSIPRRIDDPNSFRMMKSASMETPSKSTSNDDIKSKLRQPTKVEIVRLRPATSKEKIAGGNDLVFLKKETVKREEEKSGTTKVKITEGELPLVEEIEEKQEERLSSVNKSVAIVRSTYRQEHTSIVLIDPTSTSSTLLIVEETFSADTCTDRAAGTPPSLPIVSTTVQGTTVPPAMVPPSTHQIVSSPDEPMDTNMTPTEERILDEPIIIRPINEESLKMTNSQSNEQVLVPIKYEKIVYIQQVAPPVFRVPAPPIENIRMETKSTSPLKTKRDEERDEKKKEGKTMIQKVRNGLTRDKSKERDAEKEKSESKIKPPRTPLSARSLASRMLGPSFLGKKNETKSKTTRKPPPTSTSMPLSPKSQLSLPVRYRKTTAPLAESESTVVENSPAVELQPVKFDRWESSPRSRRRHSERPPSQLVTSDPNGNSVLQRTQTDTEDRTEAYVKNLLNDQPEAEGLDPGLIDDEIRDQPMLVGDSFSPSESMDRIAIGGKKTSYEPDTGTIMSIDRSTVDDMGNETRRSYHENAHTPSMNGGISTIDVSVNKQIDKGLDEVQSIRSQLEALQIMISEAEGTQKLSDSSTDLQRENDALRRQLLERDQIIRQLRTQLATNKGDSS